MTNMTNSQIRQLRAEAAQSGDDAQVEICDRALGGDTDARELCRHAVADDRANEDYEIDQEQTEAKWSDEGIWNAVIGPYQTRETVLSEAESQSITPQDYIRSAVHEACDNGAEVEPDYAFASLCRQCGVAVS